MNREQIMQGLLTLLATTAEFKVAARRNPSPETLSPAVSPALFLLEDSEEYHRQSAALPPRRTLRVSVALYNDVGPDPNAIPSTAINNALDNIDALLLPDNPVVGRCTLGGLVYSAMIDGEIKKAPGDKTGKSAAIVPLALVVP